MPSTAKKIIYDLLDTIPEAQLNEIIDFVEFVKKRNEDKIFKDLQFASCSSTDFWDNDIDDEVWNDV